MRARLLLRLQHLGAAGVLAVGILLYCGALHFLAVVPAERALEARQRIAAERQARSGALQRVAADPRGMEIERFYRLFPGSDQATKVLDQLHGFAASSGLQVTQADYRLDQREGALAAFHVALPVRGSYGSLRKFLNMVLTDIPTASIDSLRFERKAASEPQVEAHVELTLFFAPPSIGEGP